MAKYTNRSQLDELLETAIIYDCSETKAKYDKLFPFASTQTKAYLERRWKYVERFVVNERMSYLEDMVTFLRANVTFQGKPTINKERELFYAHHPWEAGWTLNPISKLQKLFDEYPEAADELMPLFLTPLQIWADVQNGEHLNYNLFVTGFQMMGKMHLSPGEFFNLKSKYFDHGFIFTHSSIL